MFFCLFVCLVKVSNTHQKKTHTSSATHASGNVCCACAVASSEQLLKTLSSAGDCLPFEKLLLGLFLLLSRNFWRFCTEEDS